MQLNRVAGRLETAVEAQLRLGGPEVADLGSELLEVLRPAMRQTLMEVVEMAAQEINGQLVGQRVDVRLVDGEPELTVQPDQSSIPTPPTAPGADEPVDAEARITLRLPGYLKDLIAEAADGAGDSVNSFVVDALRTRAYERVGTTSVKRTIEL
ncbi:MAG TPA: DUF1778 domain-containing protein [Acidimicrobiia bacterium]|nr:DUF1778 domain-containing protein [Acidimicrobiia bacterium]